MLPSRAARPLFLAAGLFALLWLCVEAHGDLHHIWRFTWMDQHRSTARMMLSGTLRLHHGVALTTNDEQVYDGAGYTNWGYGVPLLQLPFHALASHVRALIAGFFPDRAIFFLYLSGLPPLLWRSLSRVMSSGKDAERWLRRDACSLAATALVLTCAVFPLMAYRFYVYEETLAYLCVAQLYALCAYLEVLRSGRLGPTLALALAAGLGLLIRPTGAVYVVLWGALLLLERRSLPRLAAFAATLLPFGLFCLGANRVKSGSALSFGYSNSTPFLDADLPVLRFGSQCVDGVAHGLQLAGTLARAFFLGPRQPEPGSHLYACGFAYELQDSAVSAFGQEPFFGLGVLAVLVGILAHLLARRERRLAAYVPLLALGLMFLLIVLNGMGFVWRYAFDFWPLVVIVVVLHARELPAQTRGRLFGWPAALLFAGLAAIGFCERVYPVSGSIKQLDADGDAAREMPGNFERARYGVDPTYPSSLRCHEIAGQPYGGGRGWEPDCGVGVFTNVFLGVPDAPRNADGHYELRMTTEGMTAASVLVYVNGRYYQARAEGGVYRAEVDVDRGQLVSPVVLTTVLWTRARGEAPAGRLLAMELS